MDVPRNPVHSALDTEKMVRLALQFEVFWEVFWMESWGCLAVSLLGEQGNFSIEQNLLPVKTSGLGC